MTVHLLTGEYLPGAGGVADYCRALTAALTRRGIAVRVWDTRDETLERTLAAALLDQPGWVFLQYVPNALGARGANLRFCFWLWSLRRAGADVRVMFHEPYFYFSWNPLLNGLAVLQRAMAAVLLRAARHTYIPTEQWRAYLQPYAPAGARFSVVPVPSVLPTTPDPALVTMWRRRLLAGGRALAGHFGTYGDHVASNLAPVIPELLDRLPDARFVCIGNGSETFVSTLRTRHRIPDARLHATGTLNESDAAAAIAALDVAVQPYPDGVTTRRTSVMAALSLGVATVTSDGFLTEKVWRDAVPVLLARASDSAAHAERAASLLRDAAARSRLARHGRTVYEAEFAIDKCVDVLLQDGSA